MLGSERQRFVRHAPVRCEIASFSAPACKAQAPSDANILVAHFAHAVSDPRYTAPALLRSCLAHNLDEIRPII